MITAASLPIVVIFERHWDETPKKIINRLIPKLAEEGYDTLCFEAPENLNEDEILSSHREGLSLDSNLNSQAYEYLERVGIKNIKLCDLGFKELANLMRLYVSSQRYLETAEKIKGLPSSILLRDIFNSAKSSSFNIKGIDIESKDYDEIFSYGLSQRLHVIEKNENYRMSTIFGNLLKLYQEGKGIVFICGALHAENLVNKFKEKNIQDRLLYFFPHSTKNYDNSVQDIKDFCSNKILEDHTFCLTNEKDEKNLSEKINKEIKFTNRNYKEEIVDGNSHSRFLSDFFNKNFKTFMRPGYYVDALLETHEIDDYKEVVEKLQEVNIPTHHISMQGRNYLVIQAINTKEMGENIRHLNKEKPRVWLF